MKSWHWLISTQSWMRHQGVLCSWSPVWSFSEAVTQMFPVVDYLCEVFSGSHSGFPLCRSLRWSFLRQTLRCFPLSITTHVKFSKAVIQDFPVVDHPCKVLWGSQSGAPRSWSLVWSFLRHYSGVSRSQSLSWSFLKRSLRISPH